MTFSGVTSGVTSIQLSDSLSVNESIGMLERGDGFGLTRRLLMHRTLLGAASYYGDIVL
jgi:hypothetical protein